MKSITPRYAALLLAALPLAEPAEAAEPGKVTARAASRDHGLRLYRGRWRDLAKEAAAMEKEATVAQSSQDSNAAFRALHELAFLESDRGRFAAMQRAAEASVAIGEPWFAASQRPEGVTYRDRIFHLESRGLVEKGLAGQGRLADGQAQLRRMREELVVLHLTEHSGTIGSLQTLTELDRWGERSLFLLWQIIGREACYLARAGRGYEALPLLRSAIEAARQARTGERIDAFYEIQLAPELAAKLRDLGYLRESIAVLEEFLREWDGSQERFAEQYWGARVQFAMFRSELEGPSERLLRDAKEAHERRAAAYGSGRDHWSAGVVAFLRSQLRPSREAEAELQRLAMASRRDDEFLQSLAARGSALGVASDYAQPGREQEYLDLLEAYRRTGSKSNEPPLYKDYGEYLLKLGRPAEALPIFREALRQVDSFGWRVLAPGYRLAVIAALTRLGQWDAAEAEWAVLERSLATIADLPPERALELRVARVRWLTQRGREAEARAQLAAARTFADLHAINAWQRRALDALDPSPQTIVAQPAAPSPELVTLQPVKVQTEVAPGDPQRARFALRNPTSTARSGTFIARGPAVRLSLIDKPRRVSATGISGGAAAEVRLPVVLLAGEELPIALEMNGNPDATRGEIGWQVSWQEGAAPVQKAEWRIRRSDESFVTSVLNANELRQNPFFAVSFTHQIVHRTARAALENIRFTASEAVRLECYDAATGRLLAIDAEGNGQFGDPGDVLTADADTNRALDLPFAAAQKLREVEVFVFPRPGKANARKVSVEVELLTPGGWEKCARNELD